MAVAILSALVLCGVAAGCGGAAAREDSDVTITVTSRGYDEERVLREIYAQALEAAGFEVRRRDKTKQLPWKELEAGRISGYPDHLATALTEVTSTELEEVPRSADAAYQEAKRQFKSKGLVPFWPASFARPSAVAVLRKTAEERGLKTLLDLREPSRDMSVIEGGYFCYCHGRMCLGGVERNYGIMFEAVSSAEPPAALFRSLKTGETDAALVLATEGRLARSSKWLVLLEDDELRLPAANAFWLTSQKVIDEAGPDYENAILEAQKGLTLEIIRELNAKVELDRKAPGEVAAEYLQSVGYRA